MSKKKPEGPVVNHRMECLEIAVWLRKNGHMTAQEMYDVTQAILRHTSQEVLNLYEILRDHERQALCQQEEE